LHREATNTQEVVVDWKQPESCICKQQSNDEMQLSRQK